jgi:hypothetical protein
MDFGRILKAAVIVGIVMNGFDFLVNGVLLKDMMAGQSFMNQDPPIMWLVIGDFVAALVIVTVYDKVRGAFAAGPRGGAIFGLYAGVLVNFPTWILVHLLFQGVSYHTAWHWTLLGIAWGLLAGTTTGAVYGKLGSSA